MSPRISGIFIYPVKALRGIALDRAEAQPEGLAGDRRWVLVGADGHFISQRSHPALACVSALPQGSGLRLQAAGRPDLELRQPHGEKRLELEIWRDRVDAAAAAPDAEAWFSEVVGEDCRLGWMDAACLLRPQPADSPGAGNGVSFADGYPCLLVSEASLEDLNGRLTRPMPMDRFRPNLVVRGCGPFAEDNWRQMAIGEVVLRNAGPCARCQVTTINQQTGQAADNEPLATLAGYRRHEKGAIFGVNLVVERTGWIASGDEIRILA